MNTQERFTLVMADLMRIDIPNNDPMSYSKRCAINAAREALETGVQQAAAWLRVVDAIESDVKCKAAHGIKE